MRALASNFCLWDIGIFWGFGWDPSAVEVFRSFATNPVWLVLVLLQDSSCEVCMGHFKCHM